MDYFIASLSYGPKTGSGFISPLSAECMLQYKKKAAAYMKALRKVCELLLTFKPDGKSEIIPENGNSFPTVYIYALYNFGEQVLGGCYKGGRTLESRI